MKKLVCVILAMLLLTACGAPAEETKGTEASWDGKHRAQIGGEEVVFEAWEQDGLPAEGCYYLTKDVELTGPVTVSGQLKLHLNGFTVRGAEGVRYGSLFTVPAGGELVLYDAPEGSGAVVSPRSVTANVTLEHLFLVEGTVTVAGGTVDASAISLENVANGAGFYVSSGGVLNICGGTVIGGTTWCTSLEPKTDTQQETESEEAQEVPQEPVQILGMGGAVYVSSGGVCNISGGTVRGGSAGLGGNLCTEADAEAPGVAVLSGGTVTEGESLFHGGNAYIAGVLQVAGGEISLGKAYSDGGNLYVTGTLEMTGGIIREGRCDANNLTHKRGGNICVNGDEAVIRISNAQLVDGDASGGENFGGNISVIGRGAREFTVTDSTLTGGRGHRAGNLYVGNLDKDVDQENLDYTLINVTLSDGTTSYRGSNICLDSDVADKPIVLYMENCHLTVPEDNKSDNLAIGAGATDITYCYVTMKGGSIRGGSLTIYGKATLTAIGVQLDKNDHGGSGELIIEP